MADDDLRYLTDPALQAQLAGLRTDFKEFSLEMRAMLRAVCDPISGYVPRSEISEIRDGLHARVNATNVRIDGVRVWVISLGLSFGAVIVAATGVVLAALRVTRP